MKELAKVSKKRPGFLSRLWKMIFGSGYENVQYQLDRISHEEAALHARVVMRSVNWSKTARLLIMFSIILEAIAVAYAMMTTSVSLHMDWKVRSLQVLPSVLLPAMSAIIYYCVRNYRRICDRKDHKTLEKLRSERQSILNGLNEETNYYSTLLLLQMYDPDPVVKSAAAAILASKLGDQAGLKVYTGKSLDVEVPRTIELRNRKPFQSHTFSNDTMPGLEEGISEGTWLKDTQQLPLAGTPTPLNGNDGGWFSRIAALLVGDDPTQSYAVICMKCNMHNGLVGKKDFPFISYKCKHCLAVNRPKQAVEPHIHGSFESALTRSKQTGEQHIPSGSYSPARIQSLSTTSSPVRGLAAGPLEQYTQTGKDANPGGWVARISPFLVGEAQTPSCALICQKCRKHNGLARKEEFPFIRYYCRYCGELNGCAPWLTMDDEVIHSAGNSPRTIVTESTES